MKTSELSGAALDWAVAKCGGIKLNEGNTLSNDCDIYAPSTDWAQGGLIIEREEIVLINPTFHHFCTEYPWLAWKDEVYGDGETPLIAAMRCYVASVLGDEVELPKGISNVA